MANHLDATGTQSVERVIAILRYLSMSKRGGARLSTIADDLGINRATAHRLLGALLREGLVEQNAEDRHYQIGLQMLSLMPAGGHQFAMHRMLDRGLARIARETGFTALFVVRSGVDGICLDRIDGDPMSPSPLMVAGSRWPLGMGSGSLAMLAALPNEEVDAIIICQAHNYLRFNPGFTPDALRRMVARTRAEGFGWYDGLLVDSLAGIGVAVLDEGGAPVASLSMAGSRERLCPERLPEFLAILRHEAAELEVRLRHPRDGGLSSASSRGAAA